MGVALLGVIAALLSGGAAGLYLARARRSGVIADASEHAVGTLERVMRALEHELEDCQSEKAQLEGELGVQLAKSMRCDRQLRVLADWVDKHGGDSKALLDA